jgi:hypothetical protein
MGQKTTTFINDINTLTAACQAPLAALVAAATAFKTEQAAYQQLVAQSAKRVTELTGDMQWTAGHAPKSRAEKVGPLSSEKYIEADPVFRQLEAQMGARLAQLDTIMGRVPTARAALRPHFDALNKKALEFDTYVKAKKRATLHPFKKKSVARAESVITVAKAFLTTCKSAMG